MSGGAVSKLIKKARFLSNTYFLQTQPYAHHRTEEKEGGDKIRSGVGKAPEELDMAEETGVTPCWV